MIDGRLAIEIAPSGDGTTDITTHVGVLFAHFSGRNSFVRVSGGPSHCFCRLVFTHRCHHTLVCTRSA